MSHKTGYHNRDALRLLFILDAGSTDSDSSPPKYTRVFRGEKRLQAIDFLVRYPDYFADALLDIFEETKDQARLKQVEAIFASEEPDVRIVRKLKYKHGAFEGLDTPLSILSCHGLVRPVRKDHPPKYRYDFQIHETVEQFLKDAVIEESSLLWYRERVKHVIDIVGTDSGSTIKGDQYKHPEYASAPYRTYIGQIKDRVYSRFVALRDAA